ncbi:WD40 repeat-like protein [Fomitiporia mediterranea MF3/22]|uniref:WD40 repeat-like protein n=1 Tax=Fomitiporia mediterranea (strain MF3/22) TaxID=694068 RepID=UPI0004407E76|nr:WD40 repeat-like protein [Fomitiporia mediterranea MF3/22]EJD04130.1 WD40 repeat-like protein [Fomitiporia mediterranea MF3/22]
MHTHLKQAWYDDLQNDHPFNLESASATADHPSTFRAISIFPWNKSSLDTLWNGEFATEPLKVELWHKTHEKWSGMVAVGGGSELRLFLSRPHQQYLPICKIDVPDVHMRFGDEEKSLPEDVTCVTWCLVQNADEFWPLVVFASNAIMYLFNVEKGTYHGILRGHGGKITSLAVHPVDPSILASTSYDHTCRIYDITKRVEHKIDNPRWPGKYKMAMAGAPLGVRANEPEGVDYGRCTAILTGETSGSHPAPVLGAAFHPRYPIIATCGMDRAVKLWRIPVATGDKIAREDRPLFSSADVHDAQVLSVNWTGDDKLLTVCGEATMRNGATDLIYTEPGTVVLWQWLGLELFFPSGCETYPALLRGCSTPKAAVRPQTSSDVIYINSLIGTASFRIISKYTLPPPQLSVPAFVFDTPKHTPLIALPSLGCVYLSSVQHFEPRPTPFSIPGSNLLTDALDNPRLDVDGLEVTGVNNFNALPCWTVQTSNGKTNKEQIRDGERGMEANLPKLEACTISENGRLLIAVGEREGIWIWRIPRGKQFLRAPTSSER